MTDSHGWRPSAVLSGCIVAASVVAMDPGGWYPFGPAKWHAVALAVVGAVWSTLSESWSRREMTARAGSAAASKAFERRSVAATAPLRSARVWWLLLAILGLAAAFGREPVYAWIGTPERRLGWLAWVMFAASAWLGVQHARRADRDIIARIVAITTLLLGLYSIVEFTVGAPIAVDTVGQRIGGPYGSAAFLGAALCLLLPVAAGLAADTKQAARWRILGVVAAATGSMALVGSGTRAAFVGLVTALAVFAVARLRTKRSVLGVVLAVAAVVAIGAGVAAVNDRVGDNLERAVNVTSSSRLAEWGVGARIVIAHPVLGVGPEGYRTVLADGVTANYERRYGRDVIPDRAHNGVIDVAAAGGIGAGAMYLILCAGAAVAAWRIMRSDAATSVGFAVAVVAYMAQQTFLFPVAVIDPVFWLFVGIVIARGFALESESVVAQETDIDRNDPGQRARSSRAETDPPEAVWRGAALDPERPFWGTRAQMTVSRHRWSRWFARAALGVVVAVLAVSGVVALSADRLAAQAVRSERDEPARRAARLRPDFVRYSLLVDRLQPLSISGIALGLESIDDASRVSPHDPVVGRRRAERLLDLAVATGDPADVEDARNAWTALARDRNCYRCQLGYGYALALSGEEARMVPVFERAATLAPDGDDEASLVLATLHQREETQPAAPSYNEPGNNEPSNNEPSNNEPSNNEPGNNEPSNNEPGNNEPGNAGLGG